MPGVWMQGCLTPGILLSPYLYYLSFSPTWGKEPSVPSEESIRALTEALEKANPTGARRLWRGFTTGLATGLGATVGVTLVMYLLGLTLNMLGYFEPLKTVTTTIQRILATPPPRRY